MDFFFWMLTITAIAGIVLIVVSIFVHNGNEDEAVDIERQSAMLDYINLNTKIRDIDTSISEADTVITELNDVSKNVFKEIDDKYQELLFLYNLIEDKKKSMTNINSIVSDGKNFIEQKIMPSTRSKSTVLNPFAMGKRSKVDIQVSDETSKTYKNPKLVEILRLRNEGFGVPEIAKVLGIGQGEVSLILALDSNTGKDSEDR